MAMFCSHIFINFQTHEMCLQNFHFHILSGAFLVHKGVKKVNQDQGQGQRDKLNRQHNLIICKIASELREKYGDKKECKHGYF